MSNPRHEANRRSWDTHNDWWAGLDRHEFWRRIPADPPLAFIAPAWQLLTELVPQPAGVRVCVLGSGDSYAAFALAALHARVTAVDISAKRLQTAKARADELGLPLDVVRADAADVAEIDDAAFDLLLTTNGFYVWITDLPSVFGEIHRLLAPGGHFLMYDVHPFQRPWKETPELAVEKDYWTTGPFEIVEKEGSTFEHHWSIGDLVSAIATPGLRITRLIETAAEDSRFWQDHDYYEPGTEPELLDWRRNPRAALPVWLTLAAEKPRTNPCPLRSSGPGSR